MGFKYNTVIIGIIISIIICCNYTSQAFIFRGGSGTDNPDGVVFGTNKLNCKQFVKKAILYLFLAYFGNDWVYN